MTTPAHDATAAPATPEEPRRGADPLPVTMRPATAADVPALVAMLADDPLGATRESPDDPDSYLPAFELIDRDPNQHLVVADHDGEPVGTLQLTLIPGLARRGAVRAQIEAVRIRSDARATGLGTQLVEWAVDEARRQGCSLVQLIFDATRLSAHRFYERLGFEASHLGFKLSL
jgi:GNAT superfamily N-acetyltransferase